MSEPSISCDKEFQTLLLKICKNLTDDDLEQMKFLLTQDFSKRDLEGAVSAEDVMSLMRDKGLLSVDNRTRLVEILGIMNKKPLADELDNLPTALDGKKSGQHSTVNQTKEARKEFQRMLYQIGQDLVKEDVEKMKFLLKDEIAMRDFEKASTSFQVISLMQDNGLLSYENVQRFIEILTHLKKTKWVNELKTFIQNQQKVKPVPNNVERRMIKKHFKKNTKTSMELEQLMSENQIVTLTGLLGSGKSQSALNYGCNHKVRYHDAIVWRCNAIDKDAFHSSLKQLADELAISEKIKETISTDDAIARFQDSILEEFQTRVIDGYHLIIIDDVSFECKEVIEKFVRCFESKNESTKFIITTNVKYLLEHEKQLHVKGFTEGEAIEFLSEEQNDATDQKKNNDDFRSLAKMLGYNPMGLRLAKSYIKSNHISPKQCLKDFGKRENIEWIEKDHMQRHLHSDDKLLFSTLKFQIFTSLRNSLSTHIFKMFQMIQFLQVDDIPLILFEFLPQEARVSSSVLTHSFVQALQMNSFGDLGGKDDTRFITTHSSISITLGMYSDSEEKPDLLKNLVLAFVLLLNKDVFRSKDRARQIMMLPHIRSVLKQTERTLPSKELENQMMLIFLNDLAGYAHNFEGLMKMAGEFSDKAKQHCFQVLGETEEEIDRSIEKEMRGSGKEQDFSAFEEFARRKAIYIYKKLQSIAELQGEILEKFVPKFITKRYRVPDNMELFTEHLGETESALHLSDDEYKLLVEHGMAVPYDIMKKTLLLELFLAVFYTYGRRLFYINAVEEKRLARKFFEYLFLAKELGKCIISDYPDFRPLDALLAERTGTLETCFCDIELFENERHSRLKAAVKRYEEMSQDGNNYYVFGVLKMKAAEDDHHTSICLKQLLRCFTKMIDMVSDTDTKQMIYKNGCEHAEKVLQLSDNEKMQDRRSLPGIKVRVAQFYMSFKEASKDNLLKAEKLFLSVCPKYLTDKSSERKVTCPTHMDRHEKEATYCLIEYYIQSQEQEKAANLLWALRSNLENLGDSIDHSKLLDFEERLRCVDQKSN